MRLACLFVAAAALSSMVCHEVITSARAEGASIYAAEFQAAKRFQKALKDNDRNAIAGMVAYPVERDYPLPPIKSAGEFLARWDELFDKANTNALLRSDPKDVGWRGVALANGLVWFNGGRLIAINLQSDLYLKKFEEAKSKEFLTLYAGARGYKKVAVQCDTPSKHIRIQEHDDGYHYFIWKKGRALSEKPELELKGEVEYQGSAGNATYTFNNHGYSYVFDAPVISDTDGDTLTISRNGKELSNQVCK